MFGLSSHRGPFLARPRLRCNGNVLTCVRVIHEYRGLGLRERPCQAPRHENNGVRGNPVWKSSAPAHDTLWPAARPPALPTSCNEEAFRSQKNLETPGVGTHADACSRARLSNDFRAATMKERARELLQPALVWALNPTNRPGHADLNRTSESSRLPTSQSQPYFQTKPTTYAIIP
jgi:hypothetical protein